MLGCDLTQCSVGLRTVATLLVGSSDPVVGAELGRPRPLEQTSEIDKLSII